MSAIVTERFILRPQAITDYDVWYPMYSDPKIFHLVNAPGFTPEEAWNRLLIRDYSGQHKDDYKTTDSPFTLFSAHNVYYVKLNL